jgi:hypothetical protein
MSADTQEGTAAKKGEGAANSSAADTAQGQAGARRK